jgi:mannose-1-phosphate guanylyltransferase / phosphomannomutase
VHHLGWREVGDFAVVGPNVKVWPDKVVEERAALTHSLIWGEAWERSLFAGARVSGIPNFELTPEIAARLAGAYGATLGPARSWRRRAIPTAPRA